MDLIAYSISRITGLIFNTTRLGFILSLASKVVCYCQRPYEVAGSVLPYLHSKSSDIKDWRI